MTVNDYNSCVDAFADGLFRFAVKCTSDAENARDLVQEAFAKLWTKIHEVDAVKAKSYLFTTVNNAVIDQSRRLQHRRKFENQLEVGSVTTENFDLKQHLNDALARLPEIQKSVILLRDYEGYSYQEIGEITGLNEQQVKVYIFRARKSLKEYLTNIELLVG